MIEVGVVAGQLHGCAVRGWPWPCPITSWWCGAIVLLAMGLGCIEFDI